MGLHSFQHVNTPYCLKDVTNDSEFWGKIQAKVIVWFFNCLLFCCASHLVSNARFLSSLFQQNLMTDCPSHRAPTFKKIRHFQSCPAQGEKDFVAQGTLRLDGETVVQRDVGWHCSHSGWHLGKGCATSAAPREPPSAQCHSGGPFLYTWNRTFHSNCQYDSSKGQPRKEIFHHGEIF